MVPELIQDPFGHMLLGLNYRTARVRLQMTSLGHEGMCVLSFTLNKEIRHEHMFISEEINVTTNITILQSII